jgi:hypothetical protein
MCNLKKENLRIETKKKPTNWVKQRTHIIVIIHDTNSNNNKKKKRMQFGYENREILREREREILREVGEH